MTSFQLPKDIILKFRSPSSSTMDLSSRIDSPAPRVPPQRHYADLTNDYHTDNRRRCTVSDTSQKAANDACRSQAPVTVYVAVHACVDAAAAAPHGVSCSACRGGRTLTITTAAARTMACIRNNNAQRQNQDSITSSGYGNSNVAVDGDETGTETETETETESEVEPVSGLNSRRPHTRSQSRMKLCVSRTPICQLLDKEEGVHVDPKRELKKSDTPKRNRRPRDSKPKLISKVPCQWCGTHSSPQWRQGPDGSATLCNACGLRWRIYGEDTPTEQRNTRNKLINETNPPSPKRYKCKHSPTLPYSAHTTLDMYRHEL